MRSRVVDASDSAGTATGGSDGGKLIVRQRCNQSRREHDLRVRSVDAVGPRSGGRQQNDLDIASMVVLTEFGLDPDRMGPPAKAPNIADCKHGQDDRDTERKGASRPADHGDETQHRPTRLREVVQTNRIEHSGRRPGNQRTLDQRRSPDERNQTQCRPLANRQTQTEPTEQGRQRSKNETSDALTSLGFYGIGTSTGNITYNTVLQTTTPDQYRGRVFAFYDIVWQTGRLVSIGAGFILVPRTLMTTPITHTDDLDHIC